MRNQILLGTILVSIFIPITTLATSGACSWHGGVNCEKGPTIDGFVQCNDGWQDSSVGFSETEECKYLDYPYIKKCTVYQITRLCGTLPGDNVLICEAERKFMEEEYAKYDKCTNDNVKFLIGHICWKNHGYHSYMDLETAQCLCQDGYEHDPQSGECIEGQMFCWRLFGINSVYVKNGQNKCECSSGYELNKENYKCENAIPAPILTPTPAPSNFFSQLFTPTPSQTPIQTITPKSPAITAPKRIRPVSSPTPSSSISSSPSPELNPSPTPVPSKIEKTAGHKFGTNLFVTISRIFKKLKFW